MINRDGEMQDGAFLDGPLVQNCFFSQRPDADAERVHAGWDDPAEDSSYSPQWCDHDRAHCVMHAPGVVQYENAHEEEP